MSKISLQIYIIVVRKKHYIFSKLKTDNSLFCHREIPTINNGYYVSRLCKEKRCFANDFVN